ncbi:hypothetical protein SACE_2772 [Saccharopolyspora erythraea NRRL 2338]|uniref:Malonyl CoA-acyl carrier protein transacylase n=1 Tax=Saccharopolyspora erythraea (strain ATCC 11635 / DSM 40517 / JCM 4748 / NBRC 13426 / NCIMB 8594 / NRRL 2338) TaxID=405948 RepID=A4FDC8_SACEN|nr:hypothetical protein SACE_2772 [Saccharopolyspora erythraea NRRL 2338]
MTDSVVTAITLAGNEDALARLADELHAEQVFAEFLSVAVPYHSARMDPIKDELLTSLEDLKRTRRVCRCT